MVQTKWILVLAVVGIALAAPPPVPKLTKDDIAKPIKEITVKDKLVKDSVKEKLIKENEKVKEPEKDKLIKEEKKEVAATTEKKTSEAVTPGEKDVAVRQYDDVSSTTKETYTEGPGYQNSNSTTDVYDYRQNGQDNYRVNVKGLQIMIGPIQSVFEKASSAGKVPEAGSRAHTSTMKDKIMGFLHRMHAME